MRQIVLDTETTGIDPKQGHRIIEIGCIELVDRKLTNRHYHQYINPEREIEQEAIDVHGITNESLADKPVFAEIAQEFLAFVAGAELIIHNAPFDIGFIDHELDLWRPGHESITQSCGVIDTLVMAREKHPGQKNNLDALCKRYFVDNSARELHGALLDSEILADVYLLMTGGQTSLGLGGSTDEGGSGQGSSAIRRLSPSRRPTPVIMANDSELAAHDEALARVAKASGGNLIWHQ